MDAFSGSLDEALTSRCCWIWEWFVVSWGAYGRSIHLWPTGGWFICGLRAWRITVSHCIAFILHSPHVVIKLCSLCELYELSSSGTYVKPFSGDAGQGKDFQWCTCRIWRTPCVGNVAWCTYDLELVVELVIFETSWCSLLNSMLYEVELSGSNMIMKKWSLVYVFGIVVVLADVFRSENLNNLKSDA